MSHFNLRAGTAAQIRSQVSAAFSVGGLDGSASASLSAGTPGVSFMAPTIGSPESSLGVSFMGNLGNVTDSGRPLVSDGFKVHGDFNDMTVLFRVTR